MKMGILLLKKMTDVCQGLVKIDLNKKKHGND